MSLYCAFYLLEIAPTFIGHEDSLMVWFTLLCGS